MHLVSQGTVEYTLNNWFRFVGVDLGNIVGCGIVEMDTLDPIGHRQRPSGRMGASDQYSPGRETRPERTLRPAFETGVPTLRRNPSEARSPVCKQRRARLFKC